MVYPQVIISAENLKVCNDKIDVHAQALFESQKQCILTDPLFFGKKMCVSQKECMKMLESS